MKLKLIRKTKTSKSTVGELYVDGVFECYVLEDVDRQLELYPDKKVPGATCIPRGTYRVALSMSSRFGIVLPEVLSVPGFVGVRIHAGNTAKDTDGCPLVGKTKGQDFVGQSKVALAELLPKLQKAYATKETITIEIV